MSVKHSLGIHRNLMAVLMATLMGIAMFFGNSRDAQAEEGWVLTSGASFYYFYDEVMSNEYRGDNELFGGIVSIQPEYRFKDWFGLGLDVGLGGMVDRDASANWRVPHHSEVFYFQALITCKFIATLNIVELWGEIGLGFSIMAGNYINGEGEISKDPEYGLPARVRIGATFDLGNSIGIGVHGAYGLQVFMSSVAEAGVHFVKKF